MNHDSTLKIRLPQKEKARWRAQAKALGISLSEYVRRVVNAEVKHVEK